MNNNKNKSNNESKKELNDKQIHTLTINTTNIFSGKRALPPLNRVRYPQRRSTSPELRNRRHVLLEWNDYNRSGSNSTS